MGLFTSTTQRSEKNIILTESGRKWRIVSHKEHPSVAVADDFDSSADIDQQPFRLISQRGELNR